MLLQMLSQRHHDGDSRFVIGTEQCCAVGGDDGPADENISIAIANLLLEMGVKTVVATPHVISDVYPNTTEKILEAVEKANALFQRVGLPLDVLAGAEYYVEKNLLDRIETDDLVAWGDARYVMFESPEEQEPMLLEDVVFNLKTAGYTPVLAHAERYRFLQQNPQRILDLRRLGVKFQINHPSFHLPKISRRGELARCLYIKGYADLLGTDIHRATSHDRVLASKGDSRLFARLNFR